MNSFCKAFNSADKIRFLLFKCEAVKLDNFVLRFKLEFELIEMKLLIQSELLEDSTRSFKSDGIERRCWRDFSKDAKLMLFGGGFVFVLAFELIEAEDAEDEAIVDEIIERGLLSGIAVVIVAVEVLFGVLMLLPLILLLLILTLLLMLALLLVAPPVVLLLLLALLVLLEPVVAATPADSFILLTRELKSLWTCSINKLSCVKLRAKFLRLATAISICVTKIFRQSVNFLIISKELAGGLVNFEWSVSNLSICGICGRICCRRLEI